MALNENKTVATKDDRVEVSAELRLVPPWAWALGALALLCALYFFNIVLARQADAPAAWLRALMSVAAGLILACYLAFIGYISRDAQRRRMSPVLWTIVAIVIPNGLGILLYFILRQSLAGGPVGPGPLSGFSHARSNYKSCPGCGYVLSANCPQCRGEVAVNDSYCRSCGCGLGTQQLAAT